MGKSFFFFIKLKVGNFLFRIKIKIKICMVLDISYYVKFHLSFLTLISRLSCQFLISALAKEHETVSCRYMLLLWHCLLQVHASSMLPNLCHGLISSCTHHWKTEIYIYIEIGSSYTWCNSTTITTFLSHRFLKDLMVKKKTS